MTDKLALALRMMITNKLVALERQIGQGAVISVGQSANVIACEIEKEFELKRREVGETR